MLCPDEGHGMYMDMGDHIITLATNYNKSCGLVILRLLLLLLIIINPFLC